MIVDLLAGHWRLNRHMYNIGVEEFIPCTVRQEKVEETPVYVRCQCNGLAKRFPLLLVENNLTYCIYFNSLIRHFRYMRYRLTKST